MGHLPARGQEGRSSTSCVPGKDGNCPPTNLNSRWQLGCCWGGGTQGCPASGAREGRSQAPGTVAFLYGWLAQGVAEPNQGEIKIPPEL